MARIYATIGFTSTHEDPNAPSVWIEDPIVEKSYKADVIRNYKRVESSDKINDDFNISNQISIVAPPFVLNNLTNIRYVTFLGSKWKVSGVDIQYPRLLLTLGGLYNEA